MGLLDRIRRRFRGGVEAPPSAPGLFTARSPGVPTAHGGTTEPPATPEDLWDRPETSPTPDVGDVAAIEDVTAAEPHVTDPVEPEAALAAMEELAPPAAEPETPVEPVWDEAAWHEAVWDEADPTTALPEQVAPAGSTADEPLFSGYEAAPEPPTAATTELDPVPPLFDPPEVVTEPEPEDLAEPEGLVVETHPEVFAEEVAGTEPAPADAPEAVAGGAPTDDADARTVRVHDERLDKRPGPIRMTPSQAIRLAEEGPRATHRPDHPEA